MLVFWWSAGELSVWHFHTLHGLPPKWWDPLSKSGSTTGKSFPRERHCLSADADKLSNPRTRMRLYLEISNLVKNSDNFSPTINKFSGDVRVNSMICCVLLTTFPTLGWKNWSSEAEDSRTPLCCSSLCSTHIPRIPRLECTQLRQKYNRHPPGKCKSLRNIVYLASYIPKQPPTQPFWIARDRSTWRSFAFPEIAQILVIITWIEADHLQ